MSEPMIDAWLDGDDFSAEDLARFESWLRADAAHLREFLQAVSTQEALRAAWVKPAPRILPRSRRSVWLVSAAGLAATLLVFVFVAEWFGSDLKVTSNDEEPAPPTYKQATREISDVKGSLDIERAPDNPGVPDAWEYRAPMGIRGGEAGGSLRWLENFELELDAHAAVELNPQHPFATPKNVGSVSLISGTTRVRMRPRPGPSASGVDTVELDLPGGGSVRVKNADVTIAVATGRHPRPEPTGGHDSVIVSVASGSVVVVTRTGEQTEQTVKAGESVTLEQK